VKTIPETADRWLDLNREEYVRLANRYESLVDSSFSDFKLLAAIGALIVWPPLSASDLFVRNTDSGPILFVGFVGILSIIVIIAVRDMVKWALIDFYLEEMRILEDAIGARVGQDNATIRFAHNWPEYRARRYVPVFKRFALLFVLFLLCFPGGILFLRAEYLFAGLYLAVFAVVLAIYVSAARALQWI
jgi:hypothetical protein